MAESPTRDVTALPETVRYARRHMNFGWWSLLLFVSLGIGLESLHGFKVSWYLGVGEETRRLLWRLAHAHGAFLGLVHIAFAVTCKEREGDGQTWRTIASPCLIGASVVLPGGFFLGGVNVYGGDPGLGIALLPLGAVLLFIAILLTALGKSSSQVSTRGEKPRDSTRRKRGR